jgi:hypothetical protein
MFADNPTIEKIAYAAVVGLVWVTREVFTLLKEKKKPTEVVTGDTSPAYWDKQFEETRKLISEARDNQINAMRDLTSALNQLTMTLLRGK